MKIFKVKDFQNTRVERVVDEDKPANKVDILPIHNYTTVKNYKRTEYGINWQAIGTATVEEAEDYVKLLKVAIAEARKQNRKA